MGASESIERRKEEGEREEERGEDRKYVQASEEH